MTMATEKLTKAQQDALSRLSDTEWRSAYDLQCSLSTLNALVSKGEAIKRHNLGSSFSPRTCIEFKIPKAAQ